ncbi:MAG: division/cell wall cluster transcriptional repressor MraZ [Eubacteriales bacterium]
MCQYGKGRSSDVRRAYNHQLDAKNRREYPRNRDELGEKYTITCGVGGCLSVFSEAQMTELKEKLSKISMFDAQAQKPLRLLLAYSWDAEEDKQGRILIPENLRKYAKLEKDVVIIKNLNCIEIWSSDVWNDYISGVDFSDLAGALDSLK